MKFLLIGLVAVALLALIAVRLLRGRIPAEGKAAQAASLPAAASRKTSDVDGLIITLDVNGQRSLFLLLAADGSINRLGKGTLDDPPGALFIGLTDPAIFETVRSHLTEGTLRLLGQQFRSRNPQASRAS